MVNEQQNPHEAVYVPIDERQERIAALIRLAILDPDEIRQALDNQLREGV